MPADVQSGAPRWKNWGTPVAAFDGSTCDTRTFFRNQKLTFVRPARSLSLFLRRLCASKLTRRAPLVSQDITSVFASLSPRARSPPNPSLTLSSSSSRSTCGDWAGNQYVWQDADASGPVYPRWSTCASANADPVAFRAAFFEVNYLKGASLSLSPSGSARGARGADAHPHARAQSSTSERNLLSKARLS